MGAAALADLVSANMNWRGGDNRYDLTIGTDKDGNPIKFNFPVFFTKEMEAALKTFNNYHKERDLLNEMSKTYRDQSNKYTELASSNIPYEEQLEYAKKATEYSNLSGQYSQQAQDILKNNIPGAKSDLDKSVANGLDRTNYKIGLDLTLAYYVASKNKLKNDGTTLTGDFNSFLDVYKNMRFGFGGKVSEFKGDEKNKLTDIYNKLGNAKTPWEILENITSRYGDSAYTDEVSGIDIKPGGTTKFTLSDYMDYLGRKHGFNPDRDSAAKKKLIDQYDDLNNRANDDNATNDPSAADWNKFNDAMDAWNKERQEQEKADPTPCNCPATCKCKTNNIVPPACVQHPQIQASPIILDLDGDGVETTSISDGVYFDHDNNLFAEKTAWVGADDALLVLDANKNGQIDGGSELFGNNFMLKNGELAKNGFEALAELKL